jgi:hypothetical protein
MWYENSNTANTMELINKKCRIRLLYQEGDAADSSRCLLKNAIISNYHSLCFSSVYS